jgi:hypothetical protein
VSLNSGNNELFQESPALSIIEKHLCRDSLNQPNLISRSNPLTKTCRSFFYSRKWIIPKEKTRGIAQLLGLKSRTPFDQSFSHLIGKYVFADNNQGILPLFVRLMQNNYQGGIDSFEFRREGDSLILISCEGEKEYRYKIGIYGYEFTNIDYNGEKYTVGAIASSESQDSYRIELIYPELANTRRLELSLSDNYRLTVKMYEIPDSKIADSFISSLPALTPKMNFAIGMLESNLGKNFIERRIAELFSPTLIAISEKSENFSEQLASENQKVAERLASMGMVKMLINNFIGAQSEDEIPKKQASLGGIFSSVLGSLFSRKRADFENKDS